MTRRFAVAFLISAGLGATTAAVFLGPASPATILGLVGVLVGLRLMARSLRRAV